MNKTLKLNNTNRTMKHLHVFLLIVLINSLELFCDDNQIYGIVFMRWMYSLTAQTYFLKTTVSQETNVELIYKNVPCRNMDIMACVNQIKDLPHFKNIPNKSIFLKEIISLELLNSQNKEFVNTIIRQETTKIADKYLNLKTGPPVEKYTFYLKHLLTYYAANFDTENKVIKSNVILIIRRNEFYIGFITGSLNKLPKSIKYNVSDNLFSNVIIANEFRCASYLQINFMVMFQLINNSVKEMDIINPCIPKNYYGKVFPNSIYSPCVERINLDTEINFKGDFNMKKCTQLIRTAMFAKNVKGPMITKSNFSGMTLPLPLGNKKTIQLYTLLITPQNSSKDVMKQLNQLVTENCTPKSKQQLIDIYNCDCLQVVHLIFVLKYVVNLNENNILVDNINRPEDDHKKLIFVDPRLRLISKSTFHSFDSSITSSSSTLIEIDETTDTRVQEFSKSKKKNIAYGFSVILLIVFILILIIESLVLILLKVYKPKIYRFRPFTSILQLF